MMDYIKLYDAFKIDCYPSYPKDNYVFIERSCLSSIEPTFSSLFSHNVKKPVEYVYGYVEICFVWTFCLGLFWSISHRNFVLFFWRCWVLKYRRVVSEGNWKPFAAFNKQKQAENPEFTIALMIRARLFSCLLFSIFMKKLSFSLNFAIRLPQIWKWHFIFMAHIFGFGPLTFIVFKYLIVVNLG